MYTDVSRWKSIQKTTTHYSSSIVGTVNDVELTLSFQGSTELNPQEIWGGKFRLTGKAVGKDNKEITATLSATQSELLDLWQDLVLEMRRRSADRAVELASKQSEDLAFIMDKLKQ